MPDSSLPSIDTPALGIDRALADVVLIVDDVPDTWPCCTDALDEAGYAVLVATSGEQALATVGKMPPDIVLLDAMMPGMDGFEVAARLKADPRTAPIPDCVHDRSDGDRNMWWPRLPRVAAIT